MMPIGFYGSIMSHMATKKEVFNSRQLFFEEMFVGTLIYAVALGFFNDYTHIVEADSFSTIFLASFVLQVLTYYTFALKRSVISLIKDRSGALFGFLRFFSVWLIMFLSKFVFVWVVDLIFGDTINIYGFFGILAVVATVTIATKLKDLIFVKIGDK